MGQLASLSLHTYECRILDRDLKVVRTVALSCKTDKEAMAGAADLFMRHELGEHLAGFEIRKDQVRLLVQLTQRARPVQGPFEDACAD